MSTTRRTLLTGAAALAGASVLATARPASAAQDTPKPGRPVVFRRATVVSMDPKIGVATDTDVLVVDRKIKAVGRRLAVPAGTSVIHAHGALLHPGFVDTHRHLWQSALRGASGDWTLAPYFTYLRGKWMALYRPEDVYAATLFGMADAVDDGVTTVMDWSHNLPTNDHAAAAVDALFASGGRARFGYGNSNDPTNQWVLDGRVDALLKSRFASSDQLVTLQLAMDVTAPDNMRRALNFARDRNLAVSSHVGIFNVAKDNQIEFLDQEGFLSPRYTLVHADTLSDDSYRRIAAKGAHLSVSAESESASGQGYPPLLKAAQLGVPMSLSIDSIARLSGDMYTAMRASLLADRLQEHQESHQRGQVLTSMRLRASDVLEYATIGGARALGLDGTTGSITPGKAADLVMLRTDTLAMTPVSNPIGHIVGQAGRGDVDTVMVDGTIRKRNGQLVGDHGERARTLITDSYSYLRSKIGDAEWEQAINPPR